VIARNAALLKGGALLVIGLLSLQPEVAGVGGGLLLGLAFAADVYQIATGLADLYRDVKFNGWTANAVLISAQLGLSVFNVYGSFNKVRAFAAPAARATTASRAARPPGRRGAGGAREPAEVPPAAGEIPWKTEAEVLGRVRRTPDGAQIWTAPGRQGIDVARGARRGIYAQDLDSAGSTLTQEGRASRKVVADGIEGYLQRGARKVDRTQLRFLDRKDDVLTIMAHSDGHTIEGLDGFTLGRRLRALGFKGIRVELISCNSGRGRLARDLAEGLGPGSQVVAPLGWVSVAKRGGVPRVSLIEYPPGQWQYLNPGAGWVSYFHDAKGSWFWSLPP
jgi:hypothetical protein